MSIYTKAERKAYAKSIKQAKRIAGRQKTLIARPQSDKITKAVTLASREVKRVDVANYTAYSKPAFITARGHEKIKCGVRELIRI
ncbi:hypothetical protein HPC37_04555 [Pasteurellaceae bacterium 20609_3]|uniref:hypothetical protein n=1 Tax=Spirabiliibacterium mucosae TaxID=28156 RepID=UPI001AADF777|nr:hypothetical protein [Spirabiliibacterium mucosae]MBE2898112.1 hypothetical protein [Spirabiliibacterium mucosae]